MRFRSVVESGRASLRALCCLLLVGCYQSHQPEAPPVSRDAGARVDSGPRDSGHDAGFDASLFVPPPGVCTPPLEWRVDRFPGDTQAIRDQQHVERTLLRTCYPGESCIRVVFTVDPDGRLSSTTADEEYQQECAERALLGLCLPTFIEAGEGEASGCGV